LFLRKLVPLMKQNNKEIGTNSKENYKLLLKSIGIRGGRGQRIAGSLSAFCVM
jgi:hypothetical protein